MISEQLNIKIVGLLLGVLVFLITPISNANDYAFTAFTGFRVSDSLEGEDETTGEIFKVDVDETSSFGFILSMRRDRVSTYDLYFSRQDTELISRSAGLLGNPLDIRIDYYHLGGTVDYEADKLRPFATGGLGIARISPASDIFGTETKFSFSLGGGVKVPITENVGVRIGARALGIVTSGDRRVFCSNGQCVAQFEGTLFLQYEANIGLSIAF